MVVIAPTIRKRADRLLRAVKLRKQAGLCIAFRMFPDALALLKEASPLFTNVKDKARCAKSMAYCKHKIRGIDDWRELGVGIWYGEQKITSGEMRKLTRISVAEGTRTRVGRGKRTRTIRDVVFAILGNEEEAEVTLDLVLPQVLAVNPGSKFNEAHLAFYKSKYRNRKRS